MTEQKKSKNPFVAMAQKSNQPKVPQSKTPKNSKGFSKPPMRTAGRGR